MTLSTGVGRGYRNPENYLAGVEGRANGTHTKIVGPLRSWEGLLDDGETQREGETALLDGELDVLADEGSIEAGELRALLHIRGHVTRGRAVPLPGSRRDVKQRYYALKRARG